MKTCARSRAQAKSEYLLLLGAILLVGVVSVTFFSRRLGGWARESAARLDGNDARKSMPSGTDLGGSAPPAATPAGGGTRPIPVGPTTSVPLAKGKGNPLNPTLGPLSEREFRKHAGISDAEVDEMEKGKSLPFAGPVTSLPKKHVRNKDNPDAKTLWRRFNSWGGWAKRFLLGSNPRAQKDVTDLIQKKPQAFYDLPADQRLDVMVWLFSRLLNDQVRLERDAYTALEALKKHDPTEYKRWGALILHHMTHGSLTKATKTTLSITNEEAEELREANRSDLNDLLLSVGMKGVGDLLGTYSVPHQLHRFFTGKKWRSTLPDHRPISPYD